VGINLPKSLVWINLVRLYPGFIPLNVSMALGGRLIDFVLIVSALYILYEKKKELIYGSISQFLVFIAALLCMQGLTLLFIGVGNGYELSVRDLFEPYRAILLVIVFLAAANSKSLLDLIFWRRFFLGAIGLFAFVVLIRVSGISVFNFFVDLFWGASKDKLVLDRFVFRQTGFFVNPNWGGIFLSWSLAFVLFLRPFSRPINLVLISLCVLLVLASGSRTGLFCTLLVLVTWFTMELKIKGVLLVLVSLFFVFLLADYESIVKLLPRHHRDLMHAIFESRDLTSVGTFGDRIDIWSNALSRYFYDNYVFGVGPFKASVGSVMDNQYVKWLVWYGVVGGVLYFAFFLALFSNTIGVIRKRFGVERQFAKSIFAMYISLALSGVAGAFFDVTQLSFLLMMLSGVAMQLSYGGTFANADAVKYDRRVRLPIQICTH